MWWEIAAAGAAGLLVVVGGLAPWVTLATFFGIVMLTRNVTVDSQPILVGAGVLNVVWFVGALSAAGAVLTLGTVMAAGGPSAFNPWPDETGE